MPSCLLLMVGLKGFRFIIFHNKLKEALRISTQIQCKICLRHDAGTQEKNNLCWWGISESLPAEARSPKALSSFEYLHA